MKLRTFNVLALSLVLAFAGAAQADTLVYQTGVYDVFITSPVPVGDGSEDLLSVTLYIVNTSGTPDFDPKSFDGTFFGYTGVTTTEPLLHQHDSTALFVVTPVMDNPNFATAIDTHFLVMTAGITIITAPSETRGLALSAEPTDAPPPTMNLFGETTFGDQLTGTFSLLGAAPSTRWDLAQLVVPDGSRVYLDFFMAGGGPLDPGPDGVILTDFVIPEPATMSLLAVGGLAVLIRRRK